MAEQQTFTLTLRDHGGGGGGGGGGAGRKKSRPKKEAIDKPKQQSQPQGGGGGGGGGGGKNSHQKQKPRRQQQQQKKGEEGPLAPEGLRRVAQQIEFYFSDGNLARDAFLRKHLAADPTGEGWLELQLIASFAKIRAITTKVEEVARAVVEKSKLLLLSPDKLRLRRAEALPASFLVTAEAKPAMPVEQKIDRLEKMMAVVAAQHAGSRAEGPGAEAAVVPGSRSPFSSVGSLKFFLRRLAQARPPSRGPSPGRSTHPPSARAHPSPLGAFIRAFPSSRCARLSASPLSLPVQIT